MRPIFWFIHAFVLLLIVLVALSPVISVAVAGAIAEANGCQLDEGSAHACIVNGVDQGETLYTMGVMGWFMLVTVPVGAVVFIAYLLVVIAYVVIKKLRARAKEQARVLGSS